MKRIVLSIAIMAPLVAFGLWRDTYVPEGQLDALAFSVGMVGGLVMAVIWIEPATDAFDRLADWLNR